MITCSHWYVSIRTNRRLGKTPKKKRKKRPPQGDHAYTVSAGTCRVARGEQGEARPVVSAPRDGPHLDLERWRLKYWCQSDFYIAETTWPTYLYTHLPGGLRLGGLPPVLAPRMLVIAEDCDTYHSVSVICESRLQMRQYCRGVRTLKVRCVWKGWENAGIRCVEAQQQILPSGQRWPTVAATSAVQQHTEQQQRK